MQQQNELALSRPGEHGVSRRGLLQALAATGAAAAVAGCASSASVAQAGADRAGTSSRTSRSLRFAHLTDSHVLPRHDAPAGLALSLQQAMAQRPDMVITGGDLIMDGFAESRENTLVQWRLFRDAFEKHCTVPVRHTLGNHDVWGWDKQASGASGSETDWGKAMALAQLQMASPYYSFSQGAWRIIVLDSVQPLGEKNYAGGIDDTQFAWLAQELASAKQQPGGGQHVCIVSHIPILHASILLVDVPASDGVPSGAATGGNTQRTAGWGAGAAIGPGLLFTNRARVCRLFRESGNVKLCLSGHIHLVEKVDFMGTSYVCSGAVSGSWWKAQSLDTLQDRVQRCAPGFMMVDLFEDGTHATNYVPSNWSMRA